MYDVCLCVYVYVVFVFVYIQYVCIFYMCVSMSGYEAWFTCELCEKVRVFVCAFCVYV